MGGTHPNVVRIMTVVILVVGVAAGCGGSSQPPRSAARELPRSLAGTWANQASAVADAAATGDDCHALQLAAALRDDVIAKESAVPSRLRSQLLAGVNGLADRIVCAVPPQTMTVPQKPKPPKKPPPPKHDDHHHHHKPGDKQENPQ